MSFRPVVVVGSVRSGTNLLRDLLAALPGHTTWPCDEIPYIWRYGNRSFPNDELPPELARPEVVGYIRRRFAAQAAAGRAEAVVEKTCANTLRVPFVDRVLPDASYVFVVRDPRDAVASAMERWTARMDLRYTLRKARYVPARDVPHYGARWALNRLHKLRSPERRLRTWGPRFDGIDDVVRTQPLAATCALQWRRCVEAAAAALDDLDARRVLKLRYEDLVREPDRHIKELAEFLDTDPGPAGALASGVSARSVGSWRRRMSDDDAAIVAPIVEDTMAAHGYSWDLAT